MKTFSEWLFEKQFKQLKVKGSYTRGNIVEIKIFINPNSKELKQTVNARGVIDKKGNLYLFEENEWFIHEDIIDVLKPILKINATKHDFHYTEFQLMEAVPVQRRGNVIGVSESVRSEMYLGDSGQYGLMLFKKAAKKNPKLDFPFISIRSL